MTAVLQILQATAVLQRVVVMMMMMMSTAMRRKEDQIDRHEMIVCMNITDGLAERAIIA
jgi:hypothetical protein